MGGLAALGGLAFVAVFMALVGGSKQLTPKLCSSRNLRISQDGGRAQKEILSPGIEPVPGDQAGRWGGFRQGVEEAARLRRRRS